MCDVSEVFQSRDTRASVLGQDITLQYEPETNERDISVWHYEGVLQGESSVLRLILQGLLENTFEMNEVLHQGLCQYVCCSYKGCFLVPRRTVYQGRHLNAFEMTAISFQLQL
jgi:hypothetical protein